MKRLLNLSLAAGLCTLVSATATGAEFIVERSVGFPDQHVYKILDKMTLASCRAECEKSNACSVFTFNEKTQNCRLRDKVPGDMDPRGYEVHTGLKLDADEAKKLDVLRKPNNTNDNVNHPGGDLKIYKDVKNFAFCRAICAKWKACKAVSFAKDTRSCMVKDRLTRPDSNAKRISATVSY